MKRYLVIFLMLITIGSLVAQTPIVTNLITSSGSGIKWYSAATGGTAYVGTETLVNGQHYYASQTVNGAESTNRLDVTATITITPEAPTVATNTPSQTQMVWNWNTATGATGYKWSNSNNYSSATNMGTAVTKTENGLTCNTLYTRYVWAYNGICVSGATTMSATTTTCVSFSVTSIDFENKTGGTINQYDPGDYIVITFNKAVNPTTINSNLTAGGTILSSGLWFSGYYSTETYALNESADWKIGSFVEHGTVISNEWGDPSIYQVSLSSDGTVLSLYINNGSTATFAPASSTNYFGYMPDSNIKALDGSTIISSEVHEAFGSNTY